MNKELQRALAKYATLGEPGPALPWHEDDCGGWHQLLAGGERVVATVAEYPPDLGGGWFWCVGDGPTEESTEEVFGTSDAARASADARLREMGYTHKEPD